MLGLQFKKDPRLVGFAVLLVVLVGALIYSKTITVSEGLGFLGGALALPGLFGSKSKDDDEDPPAGGAEPKADAPKPGAGLLRMALAAGAGVVLLGLALALSGCAFLKGHPELIDLLADKTKCAIANMGLPNEEIVKRCLLQPEDIPRVMPLLGEARAQAAREGLAARDAERARIGAVQCGDAGAP